MHYYRELHIYYVFCKVIYLRKARSKVHLSVSEIITLAFRLGITWKKENNKDGRMEGKKERE